VTDKVHDNLTTLYTAFSKEAIEGIFPGDVYEFGGVEFVSKYAQGSAPDRFYIVKPLPFIEYFVEFSSAFRGGSIFELGIAEGGSTALLALVTEPRKLVAVDLEPQRLAALDEFVAQRDFGERVSLHYGIDQADHERLHALVRSELDGGPLDLVLDDASHQLGPTRTSFEALFPYLRPGGVYTIEDWTSDQRFRDALVEAFRSGAASTERLRESLAAAARSDEPPPRPPPSLGQIAIELQLACASSSDVVAEVTVNEYWIAVKRGPAEVEPGTFRLGDLYRDYFGYLPTPS
jgi:predicted O-methyltransferase YrrM